MDPQAGIRINRFASSVRTLGPGRRAVLWVQGCTLGCQGCASTDTWSKDGGESWSIQSLVDLIASTLVDEELDGLTFSGGEPFQQGEYLADVIAGLRECGTLVNRDVLVFTGYAPKRAQRLSPRLYESADALVAGPYRADLPGDDWLRSSSNQQLILNTSLAKERFVPQVEETDIQVTANGNDVLLSGLPRPGDLEQFRLRMEARGIRFGEKSW